MITEVDSTPGSTARYELQWPAVCRHIIKRNKCLHETATAIDVRPSTVPLVAMLDVLVPAEYDPVIGSLEVRLAQ